MTTQRSDGTSLADLRVLCADDDDVWRELLAQMLRRAGAAVVAVPDGSAALGVLSRAEYDVLVSDLNMPETNGLELLQQARRAYIAPAARIAVSGETTWITAAHAAGFRRVVLKPASRAEVFEAIMEAVQDARRPQRNSEPASAWISSQGPVSR